MAGPQVRGDIVVTRNAQVKKVRQGVLEFTPTASINSYSIVSGDPYSIIVSEGTESISTTLFLPVVSGASSSSSTSTDTTVVVNRPIGPVSGVGTEFRISNSTALNLSIVDSAGGLIETIPRNNTSIIYCDTATDTVGTWKSYIVDAAQAQNTPTNVPFDANVGAISTGTIEFAGTTTVAGVVTLTVETSGGLMQTLSTANLSSGTAASVAASNLINIINADETFRQSYRAYVDETNSALLHIEALSTGGEFNATTFTVTQPTGLTSNPTGLMNGLSGSWRAGTDDNGFAIFEFLIYQATHGKGIDPVYQTFEIATDEDGNSIRRKVLISSSVHAGTTTTNPLTGLITLEVNTMPSGTFAGAVDIL